MVFMSGGARVLAGLLAALVLTGCTATPRLSEAQAQEGFTDAKTGLAYRWVPYADGSSDCDGYSTCAGLEVLALRDCDRIYAEANIQDADGKTIDWTNATSGVTRSGERVELVMKSMKTSAANGVVTKLVCS